MGTGMTRLEPDRAAVASSSFVQLPHILQCQAQVVVSVGVRGLQPNGLLIAMDCAVGQSIVSQSCAQIVVCLGKIWIRCYRPLKARSRFAKSLLILEKQPCRVMSLGIIRLKLQGMIDTLRGIVVARCLIKNGTQ